MGKVEFKTSCSPGTLFSDPLHPPQECLEGCGVDLQSSGTLSMTRFLDAGILFQITLFKEMKSVNSRHGLDHPEKEGPGEESKEGHIRSKHKTFLCPPTHQTLSSVLSASFLPSCIRL